MNYCLLVETYNAVTLARLSPGDKDTLKRYYGGKVPLNNFSIECSHGAEPRITSSRAAPSLLPESFFTIRTHPVIQRSNAFTIKEP